MKTSEYIDRKLSRAREMLSVANISPCDLVQVIAVESDISQLERIQNLIHAMDRLGEFGKLFVEYKGCPRGPMGRMAGVSLIDEALSMPEIVDVDGGRWIPVQADVLHDLCDLATSHWISVNERLPKAFELVIVCRAGAEKGTVKVEHGYLDVNGWWKVYGTRTKHVTHWMPLPEPPAPEE